MSIQLIVFPQSYNGLNSLSGLGTEFIVDGINFTTVNTSSVVNNLNLIPNDFITAGSISINAWHRFSTSADDAQQTSNNLDFTDGTGIAQKLSNLSVGQTYDVKIDIGSITGASGLFKIKQFVGTSANLINSATYTSGTSGNQTFSFVAQSTSDTLTFYSIAADVTINKISVTLSPSNNNIVDLRTGQVIVDLYEDEDIPLTLSVDEFKNAAEQVKSYSKAFKLPATKRNNQIFDNIFEITRADDGVIFNPYVKTQCILNQDGFTIFEGFLRLIDIQDKDGEVSYNINLYSEVIALADVLGERTFGDLGFDELQHDYNKTNIKLSWTGSVTYTNTATSIYRNADTLKYPFVDWTHQMVIANGSTGTTAAAGMPELINFEQAFRPFLQIKYLISRIFNQPSFNFTYTSDFIDNNADFAKLYMDFNWGDEPYGAAPLRQDFCNRKTPASNYNIQQFPEWTNINLSVDDGGNTSLWNNTVYLFKSDVNNLSTDGTYRIQLENNAGIQSWTAKMRFVKCDSGGNVLEVIASKDELVPPGGGTGMVGSFATTLNANEHLKLQACVLDSSAIGDLVVSDTTTSLLKINYTNEGTQTSALFTTAREDLKQWQFLKGIMTMFNLVSIPDKSDANNIIIEPYKDVFLSSDDAANPNYFDTNSTQLNWTSKIDIQEMKLTPLTDLNKNTMFRFVEDDDDFPFQNYKTQVQGHLYGSQFFDASTSTNGLETILTGEEEVIAEPFAATVVKPLMSQYPWLVTPAVYAYDADEGTSKGFANSPRIMFNNGLVDLANTGNTYYIPAQNGTFSEDATKYLQFSHLSAIPTVTTSPPATSDTRDFHFGVCQLIPPVGAPTFNNLFNMYWLPYFNELYNPDTRTMSLKVNLSAGDINTFQFLDVVMIKNRKFRVNKIDYKPNDLSTVEFILIT
tara:strand:- start:342 stop:3089 length:2748 start_codon:yes stop_codon:yes gene_type:complete